MGRGATIMNTTTTNTDNRLGWTLMAVGGIALFFAIAAWAGLPPPEGAALFWAQIAILLLVTCGYILLAWHLLGRPLAAGLRQPTSDELSTGQRQLIAFVLAGGGMALFIGTIWDESWHRQFGIPFGEDFFWRPHLLMYFGFATAIVAGIWALRYLNRHLRGNLQQRFRSNKLIALLILNAAFLLYALPADPVWHWTYNDDLTPWSVPHLILLASVVMTLLLAALLHSSTVAVGRWRAIWQLHISDGLPLFMFAGMLLIWLQVMLIDWDLLLLGIEPSSIGLYRPEWLMAGNLVAAVTVIGIVAARLLRLAGAATAAGLLALAVRSGMIQLLGTDLMHEMAWVVALLPLLAIDLYAFYCAKMRDAEPEWRGMAVAVAISMALNFALIRSIYGITPSQIYENALAVIITALGASWLANQLASRLLLQRESQAAGSAFSFAIQPGRAAGVLAGFVAFILFFMGTATPPV